jgi:hypothetical protein
MRMDQMFRVNTDLESIEYSPMNYRNHQREMNDLQTNAAKRIQINTLHWHWDKSALQHLAVSE